jgi:hypothetical protein
MQAHASPSAIGQAAHQAAHQAKTKADRSRPVPFFSSLTCLISEQRRCFNLHLSLISKIWINTDMRISTMIGLPSGCYDFIKECKAN